MFNDIPISFKDRNESYLVLSKIHEFCKENNVPLIGTDKVELTQAIINFAKIDGIKEAKVCNWLEETLKEGIKKVMITKVVNIRGLRNKNKEDWEKLIKSSFGVKKSNDIIRGVHSGDIELCGYEFNEIEGKVDIISLNFSILLKEQKTRESNYKTIIYPIHIDIYLKNGYIVGRGKSKGLLFKFKRDDEDLETYESVNYEKLIRETFKKVYLSLNIQQEGIQSCNHTFKSSIHFMIDECTKTPPEIMVKLIEEEECRKNFVKEFFSRKSINLLDNENYIDALKDIEIFMEKYISINSPNKEIFTFNRYAYPTQIAATDEDFSSVEESSVEDTPLQCTSIFFDNKKLIEKQKKCDNVSFTFKREAKTYFPNKKFPVILEVKKGYVYVDFRQYVLEEDIKNVLSRIIRSD